MDEKKGAVGKVDFTVNGIAFAGEGDPQWLSQQLDKILATAKEIAKVQPQVAPSAKTSGSGIMSDGETNLESPGTLASYIKSKAGDSNQVRRFLATADWLRCKGEGALTTAKVTKALADNHQKRVGNPADCLNQNVSKGHCEKSGSGFYITPDGFKELGYST